MSHGVTQRTRIELLAVVLVVLCGVALGQQTKNFIPVEGANLKAKIDAAIVAGKANTVNGRFWVAYQFEVRPGVAVDFEVVDSSGAVYISNDNGSTMFDSRYETRELALFVMYDTQRGSFIRADVYNLRRDQEYGNYPVYWAGKVSNEESLNYLKSLIDAPGPEANNLAGRALFAMPLLEKLVETMTTRELKRRALHGVSRNDNSEAAANYLIHVAESEKDLELRKSAIAGLGRVAGQKSLSALTGTVDGDADIEPKSRRW